jgi:hypothetical protein
MDYFRFFGDDRHEPPGKYQRVSLNNEGLVPKNAVVGHCSLNCGVPSTMGSGDQDIKTSGRASRWNTEVRPVDDYMWERE